MTLVLATDYFYWIRNICSDYFEYFREMFLQWTTGKSNVQRVLEADYKHPYEIYVALEKIIGSEVEEWNDEVVPSAHFVKSFIERHGFGSWLTSGLKEKLKKYVVSIRDYQHLLGDMTRHQTTAYDDFVHEHMLEKLWTLGSYKPYQRFNRGWQYFGFQGNDPATDFRGMGILGLYQMIFFAQHYNSEWKTMLQNEFVRLHGLPIAVLSIQMTSITIKLLRTGRIKNYIYTPDDILDIRSRYHEGYSCLFLAFMVIWDAEPGDKTVMLFPTILERFENLLDHFLKNHPDSNLYDFLYFVQGIYLK